MSSPGRRITAIRRGEYADFAPLKHLFVVGDLRRPNPHPFVRDDRLELILCFYDRGDDGIPHWHPHITEYELVLDGEVEYVEAESGAKICFTAGDLSVIPPGTCVARTVPQGARTVAVKVPSGDDKVVCERCPRECGGRIRPYREA